jgi:hypothetical protein
VDKKTEERGSGQKERGKGWYQKVVNLSNKKQISRVSMIRGRYLSSIKAGSSVNFAAIRERCDINDMRIVLTGLRDRFPESVKITRDGTTNNERSIMSVLFWYVELPRQIIWYEEAESLD